MKMEIITTTTTANVEIRGEQLQIKFDSNGIVDCQKNRFLDVYEQLIEKEVVTKPKIVNLTPHDITLVGPKGEVEVFPPHHTPCRVDQKIEIFNVAGIPIKRIQDVTVEGLPPEVPGTLYIVSGRCFEAVSRKDLIAPDVTGESGVKDENGKVIGIRQFFTK